MTKVFHGENGGFGEHETSGDVLNVCWLIESLKNSKKYMGCEILHLGDRCNRDGKFPLCLHWYICGKERNPAVDHNFVRCFLSVQQERLLAFTGLCV